MEEITRFGQRTARGAASFRCAEWVKTSAADGLTVDYFLGTAWLAAPRAVLEAIQALVDEGDAAPVALRRLKPDLAPFYCPDCDLNYCARDWHPSGVLDEGFYDCTMGTCPHGHRHQVDD